MADPLDEVEARNAMANLATLAKAFFDGLLEQGFAEHQAMSLTRAYVSGLAQYSGGSGE